VPGTPLPALRYRLRKYRIDPGEEVRIVDYGGVLGLVPALRDPVRRARGVLSGVSAKGSLTRAFLAERSSAQ